MARVLAAVIAIAASLLVCPSARAEEEVIDMEEGADSSTAPPPEPTTEALAAATDDGNPKEIVLRRLVKAKGNIVASPNLLIGRNPYVSPAGPTTVTAEALRVYAAAGITEQVTAGAAYSFVLNDGVEGTDFSARGALTLFGSYELLRKGPLAVTVGGDLILNFAGADDSTEVSLRGGATVRLTVLKKVALYTGSPLAGTPQARQLTLGLYDGGRSFLTLPLGFAVQATRDVYAYAETALAEIYFVNAPEDAMMNTQNVRTLFSDVTPLTIGGFYSTSPAMDLGGALIFSDLGNAEYWVFSLGARFHTGP